MSETPADGRVAIGDFEVGNALPLALIAGPCAIEGRDHALRVSETLVEMTAARNMPLVYKSSFDKANRTSAGSPRGIGMDEGLAILAAVRESHGCPVLTDVHLPEQCAGVAQAVDVLQIPAFLCRQTDLLLSAAATGRPINVKKGQFLAPWDMRHVVAKIAGAGNRRVLVCERGASFGYNTLVSDMRSPAAAGGDRLPGGVRRHPLGAAAGRAGYGERRAAGVRARAGAGRGGGGRRRGVHGDTPGAGRRALRRPQHGAVGCVAGSAGPAARLRRAGQETMRERAMTEGCVFIGGEYVAPEDARMSIFDAGFVWSDTVYDVTSTWAGWFFMLDEHLERFARSCAGFRLENPYSADEMRQILAECVARTGLDNCYVKIQLTRGVIRSQTRDPRLGSPQFVAYATPYAWIWGEEKCRNGAALYVSGVERVSSRAIDARYKNYNRADFVQARFEAYDNDCDDAILVGADGSLTEGPGYNIFVVKDGAVATPDANVLEGVTRRAVAELCDEERIPFSYRRVEPEELGAADELFGEHHGRRRDAGGAARRPAHRQRPCRARDQPHPVPLLEQARRRLARHAGGGHPQGCLGGSDLIVSLRRRALA